MLFRSVQHRIKSASVQKEQGGIWVRKALQSWSDSLCITGFPPVSYTHGAMAIAGQEGQINLSQAGSKTPERDVLGPYGLQEITRPCALLALFTVESLGGISGSP